MIGRRGGIYPLKPHLNNFLIPHLPRPLRLWHNLLPPHTQHTFPHPSNLRPRNPLKTHSSTYLRKVCFIINNINTIHMDLPLFSRKQVPKKRLFPLICPLLGLHIPLIMRFEPFWPKNSYLTPLRVRILKHLFKQLRASSPPHTIFVKRRAGVRREARISSSYLELNAFLISRDRASTERACPVRGR